MTTGNPLGSPSTTLLLPRRHVRLRWLAVASALVVVVALARNAGAAGVTPVAGQPFGACLDGTVPTPASPSKASQAKFNYILKGVVADPSGSHLYLAENRPNDSRIWKITPSQDLLESVAGGGTQVGNKAGDTVAAASALLDPVAVALDPRAADVVYIVNQDSLSSPPHLILKKLDQGKVRTIGDLGPGQPVDTAGMAIDGSGNAYLAAGTSNLMRFSVSNFSGVTNVGSGQFTGSVIGVAVDLAGSNVWVSANRGTKNPGALYKVDPGSGSAQALRQDLIDPNGIALDATGTRLFITQTGNNSVGNNSVQASVTEVDPATGKSLQGVGSGYARPTGLAVVNRANEKVDVFVQDTDNCMVGLVAGVPKYVPPSQPTTSVTPTTSPATDKKADQLVAPTIPTGQTGTQTQTQTQTGPQIQTQPDPNLSQSIAPRGDASGVGTGANPGFFASRSDTGLGLETGLNNAPPGGPPAPGPQFNATPAAPGAPPPPSPAPGAPFVPGGQSGAGPNVGLVGGDSQPPRGAVRYAMVGHRGDGRPVAGMAGVAIVAFFSCGLAFAARSEPGPRRPGAQAARARPRGAY